MMYSQPLHIGLICVDAVSIFKPFLKLSIVNSATLAVVNVCSAVGTGPVFIKFPTVAMLLGLLAEITNPSQTVLTVDTTALETLPESL